MLAPLPGEPSALAGERAPERLDLADLAAALAQVDAPIERVAAVDAHIFEHRRRLRLVDLHLHAVAVSDFLEQDQRIGVKPAGVEHEDLDRQAGARDGVGQDHVLGRKAARERRRGKFRGDGPEALLQRPGFHAERRRKSGSGFVTVAWYDSLKSSKPVKASSGSSPSRSKKASKPQFSM